MCFHGVYLTIGPLQILFSGYAQTIGGVIEKESGIPRREWHEAFGGISRKDILLMAATSLAHSYNKALLAKVEEI